MSHPNNESPDIRRELGGHLVELRLRAEGIARCLDETSRQVLLQRGKVTLKELGELATRAEELASEVRALSGEVE